MKSVAVDPDWRGNRLSSHLIGFALEQPQAVRADHLFCQVAAKNRQSWRTFAALDFHIVAAAEDPVDRKPRFVFQRPKTGLRLPVAPESAAFDPVTCFDLAAQLTTGGRMVGKALPEIGDARDSPALFTFRQPVAGRPRLVSGAVLRQHRF